MIRIVDYGLGNIQAFVDIFRRLNFDVGVARSAAEMEQAQRLILPGVGAFDWAMERLNSSGMRDSLDQMVLARRVPVLGVCVGMQMMARSSSEGKLPGLGWIPGRVERFSGGSPESPLAVPHMGWNDVRPARDDMLLRNLEAPRFYFLHSYYFVPDDQASLVCVTDYGREFASAVGVGHIYGTQFHPEKSHHWGVQLLKNFAEL